MTPLVIPIGKALIMPSILMLNANSTFVEKDIIIDDNLNI